MVCLYLPLFILTFLLANKVEVLAKVSSSFNSGWLEQGCNCNSIGSIGRPNSLTKDEEQQVMQAMRELRYAGCIIHGQAAVQQSRDCALQLVEDWAQSFRYQVIPFILPFSLSLSLMGRQNITIEGCDGQQRTCVLSMIRTMNGVR